MAKQNKNLSSKEQEKLTSSIRIIAKSSFYFFLGLLFAKFSNYAYRFILARFYGVETYGLYSLAIMIAGWFMSLSAFGLNEGIVRYISLYREKDIEKARYLFKYSIYFQTITSISAGLILFFASKYIAVDIFHNADLIVFLRWFAIVVPCLVIAHPFFGAMRAFEKAKEYSLIFNVLQNAVKLSVVLILLGLIGSSYNGVILSHVLGMATLLVGAYIFCKWKLKSLFIKSTIDTKAKKLLKKEILHYSIPLLFTSIISTIFYWVDSFSIGYFKDVSQVGFYNAAMPLALLLSIVPELIIQIFFPIIIKEYSEKSVKVIKNLTIHVAKWIFIINIPIFIGLFFFPEVALNLMFGAEYIVAAQSLRILSISAMVASIGIISIQLIAMVGKSKLMLYNIIAALTINVVLNAALVPANTIFGMNNSSGLIGASIATVISILFLNSLFLIEAYNKTKILPADKSFWKILFIALVSLVPMLAIKYYFQAVNLGVAFAAGAVFVLFYFFLLLKTKSLDDEDIKMASDVWYRFKSLIKKRSN